MNNQDIDQENLPAFQLPDSVLDEIYELTGNGDQHNKGFVMAYVSADGRPLVYARSETQIIEMGLRKAIEKYLYQVEKLEDAIHPEGGEE